MLHYVYMDMADNELKFTEEELEDIVERVEDRIDVEHDTRIQGSLGAFSLEIDAEQDLGTAEGVFESIWENRVEEIQDSESTLKRELVENNEHPIFG